jgi:hypothetical protein
VILRRDEANNHWHLCGHGDDTAADVVDDLVENEVAFTTTKRVRLDDDASLVQAIRGKGSKKDRERALELAATQPTAAVRNALIAALGDKDQHFRQLARNLLQARAQEPGMAEALHAALTDELQHVAPRPQEILLQGITVHEQRAGMLIEALRPESLAHGPLAEIVRSIARSHPNLPLQTWATACLVYQLQDTVMRSELAEHLRAKTLPPSVDRDHAMRATMQSLPPKDAWAVIGDWIESQPEAERADLESGAARCIYLADPAWLRHVAGLTTTTEGARRQLLVLRLREAYIWGEAYDLEDPKEVAILADVYRRSEHFQVCDKLEAAMSGTRNPLALATWLHLLETPDTYSRGQNAGLGVLIDAVPAATLAPLVHDVLPKAQLTDFGWTNVVEAVLAREEPEWKPVLATLATRLATLEDPDALYKELAERIRATR